MSTKRSKDWEAGYEQCRLDALADAYREANFAPAAKKSEIEDAAISLRMLIDVLCFETSDGAIIKKPHTTEYWERVQRLRDAIDKTPVAASKEASKVEPVAHIDSAKIEALKDTAYVDAVLSTRALPFTVPVYLRPTQQALSYDSLFRMIRAFGYTTRDQTHDIVEAILAAAGGSEK